MVDGSPIGAVPELSVIVPCWNAAGSIELALGSVLADRETSLECVVVDDGSSDGSPEILDRLARTRASSSSAHPRTRAPPRRGTWPSSGRGGAG